MSSVTMPREFYDRDFESQWEFMESNYNRLQVLMTTVELANRKGIEGQKVNMVIEPSGHPSWEDVREMYKQVLEAEQ